jgi:phosphotriesterase-related protein
MSKINSVLGPLDTSKLGFTLMHEHLLLCPTGGFRDFPEVIDPNPMKTLLDALKKIKESGVDTIVDATTPDLGRDVNLLAEASKKSGINIIACSGWWVDFPRFYQEISVKQLAELFTKECAVGISGTNIKAGILKSASDKEGVTKYGEMVLRAIARAHLKTGVPIMLHSYSGGRVGLQQLAVLQDEGVNCKHIKMDHSNDTSDIDYIKLLYSKGCFIGVDHPGYLGEDPEHSGFKVTPAMRMEILRDLIKAGCGDRICPSQDWTIIRVQGDNLGITAKDRVKFNPEGFLHVKKVVLPWLKQQGIAESIINGLCTDNPRRFFEA